MPKKFAKLKTGKIIALDALKISILAYSVCNLGLNISKELCVSKPLEQFIGGKEP